MKKSSLILFRNLGNIHFYPRDRFVEYAWCMFDAITSWYDNRSDKLVMNLDSRRETERAEKEIIISGETNNPQ